MMDSNVKYGEQHTMSVYICIYLNYDGHKECVYMNFDGQQIMFACMNYGGQK